MCAARVRLTAGAQPHHLFHLCRRLADDVLLALPESGLVTVCQGDLMSNPGLSQPAWEALNRAAVGLAVSPSMVAAREAISRFSAMQQARMEAAAAARETQMRELSQQITAAMVSTEEARRTLLREAAQQWGQIVRERLAAHARTQLSFDVTGLDRLLSSVEAWRSLDEQARTPAARVLGESCEAAAASTVEDAPEDLVAGLEETARDFAASEAGFLPPNVQRDAFVWFVGVLVLMSLMYMSFTSDTADEVIGKAVDMSPVAGGVMIFAGLAWDRYLRRPQEEEDGEDRGTTD